jgi:hypothetical protein
MSDEEAHFHRVLHYVGDVLWAHGAVEATLAALFDVLHGTSADVELRVADTSGS